MKTWDDIKFGDKLIFIQTGEVCYFHSFFDKEGICAVGAVFCDQNYVDFRFFPEEFLIVPKQYNYIYTEGLPLVLCDKRCIGRNFKCSETGAIFEILNVFDMWDKNHYWVKIVDAGSNKPENLYFEPNFTFKDSRDMWLRHNVNLFEEDIKENGKCLQDYTEHDHFIVASKLYLISE